MRAFVAITLPEEARLAAAAYQHDWRVRWPDRGVSWSRPAGFHLTLRFLGEIRDRQAEEIGERLAALAGSGAIPAAFVGPLCFPNARRPQVLGLETAGPPDLDRLAADLDRALKGLRLDPRDKPFRAHLTLGRVRERGLAVPEPPALGGPIPWSAERVALYRSFLGPGGSRYEELAAVRL